MAEEKNKSVPKKDGRAPGKGTPKKKRAPQNPGRTGQSGTGAGQRVAGAGGMSKKKKRMVLAVCVLAVAAIAVVVYLLTRDKGEAMNEGNYEQIMEDMDAAVKEGYFETYMNTSWTFEDGTSETQDAILGNSPNNKKPIRCEVILDDTGETVLKTDVLPVGTQMPPFKLDVDLNAGTYEATCQIYLLNEKEDGTYEDSSDAGFHVTITVEN